MKYYLMNEENMCQLSFPHTCLSKPMKSPIGCLDYLFISCGSFSWVSMAGWHHSVGVSLFHHTEEADMKLQIKTSANLSYISTESVLQEEKREKENSIWITRRSGCAHGLTATKQMYCECVSEQWIIVIKNRSCVSIAYCGFAP